jgi:hypothetical protein
MSFQLVLDPENFQPCVGSSNHQPESLNSREYSSCPGTSRPVN